MKKRKSSLAVGFPTIVNILVLLAFTCVSLLSLSRAQADRMTAAHGWDAPYRGRRGDGSHSERSGRRGAVR